MNLSARAAAYAHAFPQFPASHLRVVEEAGGECLYGTWLVGNNYRAKSALYGAYPPGYLDRVMALFPQLGDDVPPLHACSGSLPEGPYVRLDVNPARRPDFVGSVYDAATILSAWQANGWFKLVLCDPPYSAEDAVQYETAMVDRRRATAALAEVTRVGGHLVWLDTVWPMFSRKQWRTVGRIALIRSTNHRVRLITIFERVAV